MSRKKMSPAVYGWSAVAAVVVAYDSWALLKHQETMTAFFYRMVDRPQPDERRAVVGMVRASLVSGWLGLTWHLLNNGYKLLPDPYHATYKKVHPLWRLHDVAAQRGGVVAVLRP